LRPGLNKEELTFKGRIYVRSFTFVSKCAKKVDQEEVYIYVMYFPERQEAEGETVRFMATLI